jgi:hypothetical protein
LYVYNSMRPAVPVVCGMSHARAAPSGCI